MDELTRQILLRANHVFYREHAATFDAKRQAPWQGWRELLPHLPEHRPLRVLDAGCGNGRFGLFLAKQAVGPMRYLGLDGSETLLARADERFAAHRLGTESGGRLAADLIATDLLAADLEPILAGRTFDLAVLFGVLHHLPGLDSRRALVRQLAASLAPGGRLVLSFWRFDPERRRVPWDALPEPPDPEQLEPGDFLLSWDGESSYPRYCHLASDEEIETLAKASGLAPLARFSADGRSGRENLYLILAQATPARGTWDPNPRGLTTASEDLKLDKGGTMHCIDISNPGDPGPENYIFGYGSLIEDESRERTTPTARFAWPARAKGIQRGWWARGSSSGMTTTYLGALEHPKSHCNGVVYKVSAEELAATDRRESAGYKRCEIDRAHIRMLDGRDQAPEGKYWAYLNTFPHAELKDNIPSPQFPMVQSYVDICINGCLEVQGKYPTADGFAKEFIESTDKWSKFWVNDRVYPRRPFIFRPTAGQIDNALKSTRPTAELYYEVELEPATWEYRKPVRPRTNEAPPPEDTACVWEQGG